MSAAKSDVAPATVSVALREGGIEVEYLDGRVTFYHGVPERVSETLTTAPGKQTHVLVTDPTETEGVLMYVNDRKTADEILEDSGVGRVVLDEGETEELFPGVTVRRPGGQRTEVEADPEVARGRVFVFAEDDWSEHSYELVNEDDGDDEGSDETAGESDDETSEADAAADERGSAGDAADRGSDGDGADA